MADSVPVKFSLDRIPPGCGIRLETKRGTGGGKVRFQAVDEGGRVGPWGRWKLAEGESGPREIGLTWGGLWTSSEPREGTDEEES